MHLDHLSFAAGPQGLNATVEWLSDKLSADFVDGGFHPQFGTRNQTLPLTGGRYLEVVEVLDHPAADKAPFGQAVRARSQQGGGWLAWVVAVDDIAPLEERIGRPSVEGHRYRPDGRRLVWRQLGVRDLQVDPQLPYFVQWTCDQDLHPSAGADQFGLTSLEMAGDRDRVDDWLGGQCEKVLADIDISWLEPQGRTGLVAATFSTPRGDVRI